MDRHARQSASRQPAAVGTGRRCPIPVSRTAWFSYQIDVASDSRRPIIARLRRGFADHTTYSRVDLDLTRNDRSRPEVRGTIGPSLASVISPAKPKHPARNRIVAGVSAAAATICTGATIVGSAFYRDSTIRIRIRRVGAASGSRRVSLVDLTEVNATFKERIWAPPWLSSMKRRSRVPRNLVEVLAATPHFRHVSCDSSVRLVRRGFAAAHALEREPGLLLEQAFAPVARRAVAHLHFHVDGVRRTDY